MSVSLRLGTYADTDKREETDVGPVEFLVLAFPGERISPEIIAPLQALRRAGSVRLIDSLVVSKSEDDTVVVSELDYDEHPQASTDQHAADSAAARAAEAVRLLTQEDAAEAAELLDPGSLGLLLLVEHVWAEEAANAFQQARGRVVASVRIPPEQIAEARRSVARTRRRR
jgi:uncharacterized membrane protein